MEKINDKNFEEKTKEGVVVVDFFATWCGPCRMLSPIMEEIEKEYENVKFYKVDVDESEKSARSFGVMSIPTVIFFQNGQMVDKFVGYRQKDEIVEKLNLYV